MNTKKIVSIALLSSLAALSGCATTQLPSRHGALGALENLQDEGSQKASVKNASVASPYTVSRNVPKPIRCRFRRLKKAWNCTAKNRCKAIRGNFLQQVCQMSNGSKEATTKEFTTRRLAKKMWSKLYKSGCIVWLKVLTDDLSDYQQCTRIAGF